MAKFVKGQSGNPGGRPKMAIDVRNLARSYTDTAINTLVAVARDGRKPASARVAAAEALLNRGWGKPTQPLAGDETAPLLIRWLTDASSFDG